MAAQCIIDGSEVRLDHVAKRVMNLGQEVPGLAALPYTITLELGDLEEILAAAHRSTQAELMQNAQEDEDEIAALLAARGWPDLRSLATKAPDLFERYIRTYLLSELLDGIAVGSPLRAEYQLNELSRVVVHGCEVVLSGHCYRSDALRARP